MLYFALGALTHLAILAAAYRLWQWNGVWLVGLLLAHFNTQLFLLGRMGRNG